MTDLINPHLQLPGIQQAMLVYFSGVGHVTRGTVGGEASKHRRAFESALRMLGDALRTLGGLSPSDTESKANINNMNTAHETLTSVYYRDS